MQLAGVSVNSGTGTQWLRRAAVTLAYVTLFVAWWLLSNRLRNPNTLFKALPALAAAVLFAAATSASSIEDRRRSLWVSAIDPAACVAAAALLQAMLAGFNTGWGASCNQCRPLLFIVAWPAIALGVSYPSAIAVAALARLLSHGRGVAT